MPQGVRTGQSNVARFIVAFRSAKVAYRCRKGRACRQAAMTHHFSTVLTNGGSALLSQFDPYKNSQPIRESSVRRQNASFAERKATMRNADRYVRETNSDSVATKSNRTSQGSVWIAATRCTANANPHSNGRSTATSFSLASFRNAKLRS